MLDNEVTMLVAKQIEEKRGGQFFSSVEDLIKEILKTQAMINDITAFKIVYVGLNFVFLGLLWVLFFKIWREHTLFISILIGVQLSCLLIRKFGVKLDTISLKEIFVKAEKIKETYTTLVAKDTPPKHQYVDLSKYGGGHEGFKAYVKSFD